MAKFKAFVAKLEDVPEAHREFYVEDTDKEGNQRFKLDADGLEDVEGLKGTVRELRKELKTQKDRVKPLESIGEETDVEAVINAGLEVIEARKSGKPVPEVESVKNQLNTQHKKTVDKLNETIQAQNETLRSVLIEQEVRAVLGEEATRGNAALILPVVKTMSTVVEADKNGKKVFRPSIVGEDGQERVDSKGNPLSIRGLVAELREKPEYSDAFYGSGASGSGTPPEGGSGMRTPPSTRKESGSAPTDDVRMQKRRSQDYSQI